MQEKCFFFAFFLSFGRVVSEACCNFAVENEKRCNFSLKTNPIIHLKIYYKL